MCVDSMFSSLFEEVVDHAVDTKITSETYFEEEEKKIKSATRIIRPLGILLTIVGLFLLF